MKGATAGTGDAQGSFKVNYLEIPVLARFDIPASGGVKPFLYAGPSIAFNRSGRAVTIGARYDHSLGKLTDDGDAANRVISLIGTFEFP